MACPYFYPTEKCGDLYWPFPRRLPLRAGFRGSCTATRERAAPGDAELRDFCNVGYAHGCRNLPEDRRSDAVRFSVAAERDGVILVRYTCERDHAPVEHGELKYDPAARSWRKSHNDRILQRQAECFVAVYLEGR